MKAIFNNKALFLENAAKFADLWDWAKPLSVTWEELKRREVQSRKFHAMCDELAEQLQWAGSWRTGSQWKHLLVSGHTIATNGEIELVEGLEGEVINIRESTATMTIKRLSSLIEYTYAFATNQGVKFKAPDYLNEIPPERP